MPNKEPEGLSAEEFFKRGEGYTYQDFTLLDTIYTTINEKDISLRTNLGKGVALETPIIAAPMDSVANASLCIALALQGGIGAVHFNYKKPDGSPDIKKQIDEIRKVKRFQSGFIENPISVSPDFTIAQVVELMNKYRDDGISITNFPVTADGTSNGKLVGLLRRQDYFAGSRLSYKVKDRMISVSDLAIAQDKINFEEAVDIIWQKHLQALPVVDGNGNLEYLVTRSDIEKGEKYPLSTKDKNNRLQVLFAVNTWPESIERLREGFAAGADGVIVDTSQGYEKYADEMLDYIAKNYPDKLLIGGNISTVPAARHLANLGFVDAYRNGQGSGKSCITEEVIGASRANATGVYRCSEELRNTSLKTIADGGIKTTGHIIKALALGAHAVMLGGMLAGTEEAPGEVKVGEGGTLVKEYWGMGSKRANTGAKRGYSKAAEGVETQVRYNGSIHKYIPEIKSALRHGLGVKNCRNIEELQEKLRLGEIRLEKFVGGGTGAVLG